MKEIKTMLATTALFSNNQQKRYLLRKEWDSKKPSLAVIMLAPSDASGIVLDSTTLLVLNNASRLGYGSVAILNLFATLNNFDLKHTENEDPENLEVILQMAEKADTIVYAAGVGKAKNNAFQLRQEQVLTALLPFQGKLNCLCNETGDARHQHPLSPQVRTWYLSPLKVSELLPATKPNDTETKKKPKQQSK